MTDRSDGFEKRKPVKGARWSISCKIGNEWVGLIERTKAKNSEITKTMRALELSPETIDYYFPTNKREERCPTFELMRLFHYKLSSRPQVSHAGEVNV